MANEWEVNKSTGRCAVTGRELGEGEPFFAVLFERPTGLERLDYSPEAWTGPPEDCFCYWRSRIPTREKKPSTVNVDHAMLTHLFLRLEDETSEFRQQLRFVLALLLMRKRLLKFEQTVRDGQHEYWQMRLMSEQSVHQVLNPRLTDEQAARLSAQLTAILSGDVEAVDAMEPSASNGAPTAGQESIPAPGPTTESENGVATT